MLQQLKHLAVFGALAASALASPTARDKPARKWGDDDDDTPLPLVIWHGE